MKVLPSDDTVKDISNNQCLLIDHIERGLINMDWEPAGNASLFETIHGHIVQIRTERNTHKYIVDKHHRMDAKEIRFLNSLITFPAFRWVEMHDDRIVIGL